MDSEIIARAQMEEIADHSSDSELDDVKEELEVLEAENIYHNFLLDVSAGKQLPTEDPDDKEFRIEDEIAKAGKPVDEEGVEQELLYDRSSDSDSSVYEEASEDLEEHGSDVQVPHQAAKEAADRYPPFWRVKDHLMRHDGDGYKSDEDTDYHPAADEVIEVSSDSDSNADAVELDDDEQVSGLIEMIDELAIPHGQDVEIVEDEDQPVDSLARSIVEFDNEGYKSEEDPDYLPSEDLHDVVDDSASSEDSADEMEH